MREIIMENRKFFWAGSVILLAAAIVSLQISGNPTGALTLAQVDGLGAQGEGLGAPPGQQNPFPNPDRNQYGIGVFPDADRNPVQKPVNEAFANLPEMSEDFGKQMHGVRSGGTTALAPGLGEAYFKQPEFLPEFEKIGLRYWKAPDLKRWGREGFGVYPAEQSHSVKAGNQIYITAFVHSAYGIETWQGMSLAHSFPENGNASEFFSVEAEPKSFLLGPTYPVMDANWIQKIVIKISVRQDTPNGTYLLGFNSDSPEPWLDDKWAAEHRGRYVSGRGMVAIGKPRLGVSLRVE